MPYCSITCTLPDVRQVQCRCPFFRATHVVSKGRVGLSVPWEYIIGNSSRKVRKYCSRPPLPRRSPSYPGRNAYPPIHDTIGNPLYDLIKTHSRYCEANPLLIVAGRDYPPFCHGHLCASVVEPKFVRHLPSHPFFCLSSNFPATPVASSSYPVSSGGESA